MITFITNYFSVRITRHFILDHILFYTNAQVFFIYALSNPISPLYLPLFSLTRNLFVIFIKVLLDLTCYGRTFWVLFIQPTNSFCSYFKRLRAILTPWSGHVFHFCLCLIKQVEVNNDTLPWNHPLGCLQKHFCDLALVSFRLTWR